MQYIIGGNFIVSFIELAIWISFSAISGYGTIYAIKYYSKTQLAPVIIIGLINSLGILYGLFYFFGRLYSSVIPILLGLTSVSLILVLATWFLRAIFGPHRNYLALHFIQTICGSIATTIGWISPPNVVSEDLIYPLNEQIFMMGSLLCFCFIAFDYIQFSLSKITKQKLDKKLKFFPIVLLIGMIGMVMSYLLTILGILPLYLAVIPALLIFSSYGLILKISPALLLVAPSDPIFFELVHRNGLPLYSKEFASQHLKPHIRGVITAIDTIFNIYVDKESSLQIIQFSNLVCYIEIQEKFIIVYIDKFFSQFIQKQLNDFTHEIASSVTKKLETWDGNMRHFDEIGKLFAQKFDFLPVFLKASH